MINTNDEFTNERSPPVVGIGASAGGLRSIERLFDNLPADTGMAYVVVQHLARDHKSLMREILSRHSKMPVNLAADGASIRADQIYIIPPGKELRCIGDTLTVSDLPSGLPRPIDTFSFPWLIERRQETLGSCSQGLAATEPKESLPSKRRAA